MLDGELDLALITSAEALATQRVFQQAGRAVSVFVPARREAPVPVGVAARSRRGRARGVPGLAHVRGLRQRPPGAPRRSGSTNTGTASGAMLAPMTDGRGRESARLVPRPPRPRPRSSRSGADNRMVGYPYTKYMVAVMDVDMAAALVVATHERADALGVPARSARLPPRLVRRERSRCWWPSIPTSRRSPAMARRECTRRWRGAGVGIDDIAHLDLYSCFPSSLHFAADALGIDPTDAARPDRHRRARVSRWSGERLPDPLDRGDGRAPPRPTPARSGWSAGSGCT